MKAPRVTELGVHHLQHLFSPEGIPLPSKGASEVGTTSILIRGGPGTGKTTLALALAHSIARKGEGTALYLATEFSPVELRFKATLLGLADFTVSRWPGEDDVESGAILVEHLSQVGDGEQILSDADRRVRSIDAVWELLHPASDSQEPASSPTPDGKRPVRVVVVDALAVPEPISDGAPRADLVAFIQALESEGCSVILVEELIEERLAWTSFVVDVVLSLTLSPHPETGALRRQLAVLKTRFSISTPGPHDYGLQEGHPAVKPSLIKPGL